MPKYRLLRERLVGEGVLAPEEMEESRLIDRASLLLAHTPEYLDAVFSGTLAPAEQRRLAATGAQVRVYVPYGSDWYGYLVRRLAERPANLAFFLRSLASRR